MNVLYKNLFTFALLVTLAQALSAFAEVFDGNISNAMQLCQKDGVACKSAVAVLQSIDDSNLQTNNKPNPNFFDVQTQTKKEIYNEASLVESKVNCNVGPKKHSTPLNQMMLDLDSANMFKSTLSLKEYTETKALKDNVDYDAISQSDAQNCMVDVVPVPTAGWLFASALVAFITFSNRRMA